MVSDLWNTVLFGMTAKQWRDENPKKDGNIRDYDLAVQQMKTLGRLEINELPQIEEKK